MRRLPIAAALIALALAIFGAWMHWRVLDPRNVGWLLAGEDRGQSAIGLAAYFRAGHWPSLHEPLLDAPEGLTLLFTDSIPLLGILLGPFAPILSGGLQFIGPWLFACVLLQVTFAWLLIRPHAPDTLAALLGAALLALMPALINRYGHASLCAQWLVLWALWVFVDPRRSRQAWRWAAVLGIAALVHSYLLLMAAAFWGSAMLRDLLRGRDRARTAVGGAAVLLLIAAIGSWHGVFAGHYQSTGTYGAFPMALDAWWNPANPGYTTLLPSSPDDHARGFEGLQYLGAGLLLLVAVAFMTLILRHAGPVPASTVAHSYQPTGSNDGGPRNKSGVTGRGGLRGLLWLLPAFAVIALFAIGPQPLWRGEPLFTWRLPPALTDALDPIRAAGRLAWPLTYTLAYTAIIAALRLPRATLLLGAALALQVIDLAPMLAAVRAASARADDPRMYHRTNDPRWSALVGRASAVQFEPAEPFRDLQLMEEVAWRAVAACRPVRYFYASRDELGTRTRIDADSAAFRDGRLDPTRLYVLLNGRAPTALAGRVRHLDGVAIVPPTAPAPPSACR